MFHSNNVRVPFFFQRSITAHSNSGNVDGLVNCSPSWDKIPPQPNTFIFRGGGNKVRHSSATLLLIELQKQYSVATSTIHIV